jgi:probable F420-dependent oxidoreductase
MVKLGTAMPEQLIGTDPGAFKDFLQGAENIGYDYVTIGDHVLGADLSVRPDWKPYAGNPPLYDHTAPWHEPFVLFGYMAAITKKLQLCTGILVSPQRQAALMAKQAAEADILSGGRVRLVISAGWNDVEYEGMGVDFEQRGKIMEEQMLVMRELWTKDVVTYHGKFHTLNAVGINPLPVQRPIPLWLGGVSKPVLRRVGEMADGWFPYYPYFSPDKLEEDLAVVQQYARAAGRDPASIGIEGTVYFDDIRFPVFPGAQKQPHTMEECVERAHWWKRFGATTFTVTAPWANLDSEEKIARAHEEKWTGVDSRLRVLEQFKKALGAGY